MLTAPHKKSQTSHALEHTMLSTRNGVSMSYATRSRQNSISSPEEIYMPDEDNDVKKGAVESETRDQHSQTSLEGQLAHRTEDARIKGRDTDFPEPGENPEHSGQDMDPGFRQKTNQGDTKDDPLAA